MDLVEIILEDFAGLENLFKALSHENKGNNRQQNPHRNPAAPNIIQQPFCTRVAIRTAQVAVVRSVVQSMLLQRPFLPNLKDPFVSDPHSTTNPNTNIKGKAAEKSAE